jgi:hypothetical protein
MSFKDEKIYSGMKALVEKSLPILDRNGFEFKYIEDSNIEVNDLKNIPPISFLLNDKISRQIYSNSKIEEIEKTKEFAYTCDLVNEISTYIYYLKCNKNEILKGLSLSVEHVALGGVLDD